MSRFVLAAACLAASIASASAHAQGVLKPVDARIVNSRSEPVPVTVLSTPAPPGEGSREVYQNSFLIEFSGPASHCTGPQALPAGKRLVLLHVGGFALMGTPAALSAVGITSPASGEHVVVVPAAPPQLATTNYFSAAGQQVHAYVDGQFHACAFASTPTTSGSARVTLHGYLVDKR